MGSLSTLLNRAVAEFAGMHPTDWECLDVLDWTGPMTAGAIAEHLGLTSGAVTGVIDRLEEGGWVRRERPVHDRRQVLVVPIYEAGAELAAAFEPLASKVRELYQALSDRDRGVVLEFMQEMNEVLAEATAHFRAQRRE